MPAAKRSSAQLFVIAGVVREVDWLPGNLLQLLELLLSLLPLLMLLVP